MKFLLSFSLLLLSAATWSQTGYDRKSFYDAMRLDNKDLVTKQLETVRQAPPAFKEAFEGALLMKKAGLGGSPTKKLSLFKEGHKKLEASIHREPANAEFRFLRLMIQEHAPGILGYKNDLTADSDFIRKSYQSLAPDVQHAVSDYSKKSKVLKLKIS